MSWRCRAIALALGVIVSGTASSQEPARPGTAAAERARRVDPFESDRAARVITAEEIWRSNARNLPDLLRQEFGPWMTFANYAGGSPIARGLGGNDILILLDGVKMNSTAYRFGDLEYLSTIDLFMLERIEIIGGAAGPYGGDTAGPVIKLYSKRDATPLAPGTDSPQESVARVFFRFSTVDKSSVAHVEAQQEEERYGFMFGLTSRDIGDLKGGGMVGFQRVTAYEEVAGNARFDYFLSNTQTLEVDAQIHEQQNVGQYDRIESGSHLAFDLDPRKRTLFGISYLDDTDRSWSDSLRATVYLQQQRQRAFEQLASRPEIRSQTSDNNDIMGLLAEVQVALGERNRLRYGFELTEEQVSSVRREIDVLTGDEINRGKDPRRDGQGRDQTTLWVEDRIELVSGLALRLGGRHSSYSVSGQQATPVGVLPLEADDDGFSAYASLLWEATETLHLFGSYDRGFRLPGIDEVTGQTPTEGFVSLPNSNLEVPTIDALEVGARYRNEWIGVELAFFRQKIADAPVLLPTPSPVMASTAVPGGIQWVRTESIGEAEIDGIELNFDLVLPLNLGLWGRLILAEGDNPRSGEPLSGIPPDHGAVGLRWQGPWKWQPWAEGMLRYSAEKDRLSPVEQVDPGLDPASLESQDTFTLRAGLTLPPRLRLTFTLENPADEAYQPYGSFLYAPGRNLALTAEYVF